MSRAVTLSASLVLLVLAARSDAVHFYRNTGSGCSPASGELTDDPIDEETGEPIHGSITAHVRLGHNTFNDEEQQTFFETRIKAGEAVLWTWDSAHCHSVRSSDSGDVGGRLFYSGFHYPTEPPADQPQAVPGFFEYPLPDPEPKLWYIHTFDEPGTYDYDCEHHAAIGMFGQVIVEPTD